MDKIREVASQLRAGQVSINGGGGDLTAPFGGYKMSGNGREWGDYGFHEYLETKADARLRAEAGRGVGSEFPSPSRGGVRGGGLVGPPALSLGCRSTGCSPQPQPLPSSRRGARPT